MCFLQVKSAQSCYAHIIHIIYIYFGGTERIIKIYFLYIFKTESIYIYIYIHTRAQYNYRAYTRSPINTI